MKLIKLLGGALIAFTAINANATVIVNVTQGAAAATAEANFLSILKYSTTETFEGNGANLNTVSANYAGADQQLNFEDHSDSYITSVGSFTLDTAGQDTGVGTYIEDLMIESDTTTGEHGRQSLSTYQNDFWLDSNDAEQVTWDIFTNPATAFDAIGFYLADAEDQGAVLTLDLDNGTTQTIDIPTTGLNQNLLYITLTFDPAVLSASIVFNNSNDHDGWGIDDVTIGKVQVPEPGSLALLGLGILGLGVARRKTA